MLVQKDVLHQAHLRLRAHAHHATREQTKLQSRLQSTRTEWAAASRANQHMVNELRKLRMQLVRPSGVRSTCLEIRVPATCH